MAGIAYRYTTPTDENRHIDRHRRPQPRREFRRGQPARLSRLYDPVSDPGCARGGAEASRTRQGLLWPLRHARPSSRSRMPSPLWTGATRRSRSGQASRRSPPRSSPSSSLATTFSWSTASTGRRAASAIRCSERFGVSTTYYDPSIGAGIAALMRPETRVIFLESPGSLTFEMQDVPAIVAVAKRAGVIDRHRQHLGDAGLFQAARPRRRRRRAVRDEIHRRAFRPDARHDHDDRAELRPHSPDGERTRPSCRARTIAISRSAACARCRSGFSATTQTALALARWLQRQPEVARVHHPALPTTRATRSGGATSPGRPACLPSSSRRHRARGWRRWSTA